MGEISMIGLDIAKNVFHVHGLDASGATVLRRQLRRREVENRRRWWGLKPAAVRIIGDASSAVTGTRSG